MVRQDKLKAYASTGTTRETALPDVPTMAEAGFAAMTVDPSDWTGLVAPAGTPPGVIATIHDAVSAALQSPAVVAMLAKLGWTAEPMPPDAFATFISTNVEQWGKVVRHAGLKAE
jgi:tripartite-type tricarboxylate transporter receptor subunit TctC